MRERKEKEEQVVGGLARGFGELAVLLLLGCPKMGGVGQGDQWKCLVACPNVVGEGSGIDNDGLRNRAVSRCPAIP